MEQVETLIVGAGVAGLSLAQALRQSGAPCRIVERARSVGGRCATRRFADQPVDHGVAFLHGTHPGFIAALRAVPATFQTWPDGVKGAGAAYQPDAFAPTSVRLAYHEGVKQFPKHLADGLDVRLETTVTSVSRAGDLWRVGVAHGDDIQAKTLVLALAAEQSLKLLSTIADNNLDVRTARDLLNSVDSAVCLTIMARYKDDVPLPDWDIWYPEGSEAVQLIACDARKRKPPAKPIFVFQSRPIWSRQNVDASTETWSSALLAETSRVLGSWAAHPVEFQAHAWRHARVSQAAEFVAPFLLDLPGGLRLGLAGDFFSPSCGLQGAWLSGQQLAARLIG